MKLHTLLILLPCLLFFSCGKGLKDGDELGLIGKSLKEIKNTYGDPDANKEVIIRKGVNLYEYQSSLYDLIEDTDSSGVVIVNELIYEKQSRGKYLAIWLIQDNGVLKVVDALEWKSKIQF